MKVGSKQVVLTPPDWKWTGNEDGDSFLKNGDVVYVKVDGSCGGWRDSRYAAGGFGCAGLDDGGG